MVCGGTKHCAPLSPVRDRPQRGGGQKGVNIHGPLTPDLYTGGLWFRSTNFRYCKSQNLTGVSTSFTTLPNRAFRGKTVNRRAQGFQWWECGLGIQLRNKNVEINPGGLILNPTVAIAKGVFYRIILISMN